VTQAGTRGRRAVPRRALWGWLAGFGAALAACSSLPDYAKPQTRVIDPASYRATDVIRYRALTRADFRASEPPGAASGEGFEMNAYTCASIVSGKQVRVEVVPGAESGSFVARATEMTYWAEMDRECSWWNPNGALPPEYTLQHEQIHFALVELRARRLTSAVRRLEARGRTREAAVSALQAAADAAVRRGQQELQRESLAFDEDTSGVHSPKRQARWLERVERELAETAPQARAGPQM
jgi:hypothetical protein